MQRPDLKRKKRSQGATRSTSTRRQPSSGKALATTMANAIAIAKALPRAHVISVSALFFCLVVFISFPSNDTQAARPAQVTKSLAIPALESVQETPLETAPALLNQYAEPPASAEATKTLTVKPGDNLSLLFQRAGLSDRDVYEVVNGHKEGKRLTRLYPGQQIEFLLEANTLKRITCIANKLERYSLERTDSGFEFTEEIRKPDIHLSTRSATIENSLYEAGKSARLEDKLVMELASIFGWDIDFALDIRQGDSFKVVYEEKFLDGEKLGTGNILAAEFTNRSQTFRAVRYEDSKGDTQYYTPTGETMRKEFLRTPIDFARISSHFNLRRKHPVLNTIRAHKGTDYAAARGTPIKSAGDGKVIFAGRQNGYGNVVIIQHGQTYQTRYAHISKFRKGIRKGVRVKQGQVIAYVGSTGLASGPHLHYEFRVNGAVRNPVTVKLPKAKSIAKSERARFEQTIQPLLAELTPETTSTDYAAMKSEAHQL